MFTMRSATRGKMPFKNRRVSVADRHQFQVVRMDGDGAEVVGGDAPAADEGQADFAVGDGLGHGGGKRSWMG